ncbi:MAG: ATP-binding protein, partial [Gammaproteobacteria bacterium]|nr:ATP-binding protein [Gammaproteobacteria bacterium]
MNNTGLWGECLVALRDSLSEKQMKTWIHPLEASCDNGILSIVAPNKYIRDAVETDFIEIIEAMAFDKSNKEVSSVKLSLLEIKSAEKILPKEKEVKIRSWLNSDLTFESFVEGKSNQLAKAACSSVVKALGQYNPLYIYGGVGLGKTHLLHSIGNEILKQDKEKKVVYLHSEKFVQNMVTALRTNKIEEFKDFYRSVDALLLD